MQAIVLTLCLAAVNLCHQPLRRGTRHFMLEPQGQWQLIRMATGLLGDHLSQIWRMHHTSANSSSHPRDTRLSNSTMIHSMEAPQLPMARYSPSVLPVSHLLTCRKVRCNAHRFPSRDHSHQRSKVPIRSGRARDTDARTAFVSQFIRP